jgi:hypothetical protein
VYKRKKKDGLLLLHKSFYGNETAKGSPKYDMHEEAVIFPKIWTRPKINWKRKREESFEVVNIYTYIHTFI